MGKKCVNSKDKNRAKRVNTKKFFNKLVLPQTGGQRKYRTELKKKCKTVAPISAEDREYLKFGSINIDGIDLQKNSAIHKLINTRGFDVGRFITIKN